MSKELSEPESIFGLLERARRNTLSDLLVRTSSRYPDKPAVQYQGKRLTYGQLDSLVNRTAGGLREDGIKKGTMVAVLSNNSLDFVVLNFALARIGAVMVPLNYMLHVEDIQYILDHAGIEGIAASAEYAGRIEEAAARNESNISWRYLMDADTVLETQPDWKPLAELQDSAETAPVEADIQDDDLAHVLYTSGTESKPKGVMLTHKSLIAEYVSSIIEGEMEASDIAIHALPFYHSAQLHVFLGPGVYVGSTGIILPQASPEAILESIERERATQLFCPPTVWIALLRHPDFERRDLSSLQKCYYGAAIMPREILKELMEKLPQARFWNFYGQTEVAPLAAALQPEDQLRKLGAAGKAVLHVETKIVDDNDEEVPRNQIGEIVHRTPHAMKGYLHDPEKTAEAFRGGWFHSGDLGVMDKEGYITIIDRKKDMINTGGVNVSSREVEETLYELEGVSEAAVISIPDSYWIEAVTAIIVPKQGSPITREEVLRFCKEKLSTYKVPKYIEFAETMPKNPSGKLLKRTLRETYKNIGS
ncbi:long-chain-fatty-acid--CoA ligase [Sediminibacillus dalangtanensis]|uniref:Long-chain-fatty-acid--CoA ligase n=1 Tax=Sediminibacillus dalangtanensis TaxID=2729421 RepID=A0ABX7VUW7_9BACI|nr:fatty acyl-CoA synthetase [Sediminibacillus dalangtanensis]QTM99565.1 long-chain-fatty-acid--CoA ligase [Sediminibacillus dalangtanensis]